MTKNSRDIAKAELVVDQHGKEHYRVTEGPRTTCISRSEYAANHDGRWLFQNLAKHGISVTSTEVRQTLRATINKLKKVTGQVVVASRPGWATDTTYVFGDGTAYTAGRIDSAVIAMFQPWPKHGIRGSLEGWKVGVGGLLDGQHLLQTLVCFALTGPLLRHFAELANITENVVLEINGSTSRGKTTGLHVAGSTWGAEPGTRNGFLANWRLTKNGLETLMEQHADGLLAIDEATLAGEGRKTRRDFQQDAVMMVGFGQGRARHGVGAEVRGVCLALLSTSNEPLNLCGPGQSKVDQAVGVRLLSYDISDRPFGVLDHPGRSGDPTATIEALRAAFHAEYGHVARSFVQRLTRWMHEWPEELRSQIATYIASFREHANHENLLPEQQRVCNHFALVFAAGQLGRRFGVLPRSWNNMGYAVLGAFQHVVNPPPDVINRFEQMLESRRGDILDTAVDLRSAPPGAGQLGSCPNAWCSSGCLVVSGVGRAAVSGWC